MLKKKKFMNMYEWKNKFSGAYMTIPACSNWQDWNQFAFLYPENGLQIWRKSVLLSSTPPCSTSVGSIIRGGHPRLTSGPLGKRGVWDHCLRWDSNKNVSQRQTNTQTARNWSSFVKSSPAPSCEGIKKRWSYFTIVCRGAKQEKRRTFRCGYYLII